jgi:hypothetical protein
LCGLFIHYILKMEGGLTESTKVSTFVSSSN